MQSIDNGVNFTDANGTTLLMYSALNWRNEFVTYLLQNGALINAKDKAGRTAVDYAVIGEEYHSLVNLLKAGAEPTARSDAYLAHNALTDENYTDAAALYKSAIKKDVSIPVYADYLFVMVKLGKYSEAYTAGVSVRSRFAKDPLFLYNLACAASRCKKYDEAIDLLGNANANGYRALKNASRDQDLAGIRDRKEFKALLWKCYNMQ